MQNNPDLQSALYLLGFSEEDQRELAGLRRGGGGFEH
jgi:hypothetical protein